MDKDLKKRLLVIHAPSAVFFMLLAAFILYSLAPLVVAGEYFYHTKTNLGRPVHLALIETPVLVLGLAFTQLALAAFCAGLGVESTYHVIRLLRPTLNWSLRPKFKLYRLGLILLVIGMTLLVVGILHIAALMFLQK